MSEDIVKLLHDEFALWVKTQGKCILDAGLFKQAADEIERLRAKNANLLDDNRGIAYLHQSALEALEWQAKSKGVS